MTDDYTEEQKADKAPFLRDNRFPVASAEQDRVGQLRTLMAADEMIDAAFRRLEADGELDNTLAIFTSDNGRFWAEHGMRSKSLPYTESVQVPFMVRWPGHFPAGGVDPRLVGLVDITPTVLAAAGVTPGAEYVLDGRSFLDPAATRAETLLEYAEDPGFSYPAWASLRGPAWQYLEYYADDGTTVDWAEYYDLAADPYQVTNLLADADPGQRPGCGRPLRPPVRVPAVRGSELPIAGRRR